MKTILFDFDDMGGGGRDKALAAITKAFERNGVHVVDSEVGKVPITRAGVQFRPVHLTFADGQTVSLGVKQTGDVFEVKINGGLVPIREQDDHAGTVREIAGLLDKRRALFQRAMARVKMPIPPVARSSRTTVLAAKIAKRDALQEAVGMAEQELAELNGAA